MTSVVEQASGSPATPSRRTGLTPDDVRSRSFWLGLVAIAGCGLALRLWYGFTVPGALDGDSNFYHLQANVLADGRGFIDPFTLLFRGTRVDTAAHPPLWSFVLSASSWVGFRGVDAHRVIGCLIGTATIVVIGLVGRRVIGSFGGLIAAGISAAYVNIWISDPLVEATSLYILLIAIALLVSYRWIQEPSVVQSVVLGVVIGLAILTRGEALGLVLILAAPTILLQRELTLSRRFRHLLLVGLASFTIVLPWSIYNATRFERFIPVTTDGDFIFADSYCDQTFSGRLVGDWTIDCRPVRRPHEDESAYAERVRGHALDYVRDHLDQLPRVSTIRVLRAWDLFRPSQNLQLASVRARDLDVSRVGQLVYWSTLPFAAAGILILVRAGRRVTPMVAMIVLATLTAAATLGEIRYRGPAEVSIVLLAAAALTRLAGRLSGATSAAGSKLKLPARIGTTEP